MISKPKKRAYHSEHRNIQAAQTKNRILETAQKLFQKDGFECVTIEKLAKESEVSEPTIYALFQSKRGVLLALIDGALPKEQFEALLEKTEQEKDVKKRVAYGAKIARKIYDAERAFMDIFRGASVLAPEFKKLEQEQEQRRYLRQEETIVKLMNEESLHKGLNVTRARDIFWALTGRDLYRLLVVERGWSSDEYESWLGKLLVKTLIKG